jgi:hypothetical protein
MFLNKKLSYSNHEKESDKFPLFSKPIFRSSRRSNPHNWNFLALLEEKCLWVATALIIYFGGFWQNAFCSVFTIT